MSELPIVLLPGSLCDERLFEHQMLAFGSDATVADLTRSNSIEQMAVDVLAEAPSHFVAVGLSLGGIVAAEIAATAPDRLAGLALLDTNLAAPDVAQLQTRRCWARMVRSGEFAAVVTHEMLPQLTAYRQVHCPTILAMAYGIGPSIFLEQNDALMSRRDRRANLEGIECPVLIACGSHDKVCTPAIHEELASRSPNAWLEIIDGAGHLSTLDQPAAVTRTLTNFLDFCNIQTNHPRRGSNEQINA